VTLKAKDMLPDQKMAIVSLLGRSIAENEEISIPQPPRPPSRSGSRPLGKARKSGASISSLRKRLMRR
jgi:hypothetical protein